MTELSLLGEEHAPKFSRSNYRGLRDVGVRLRQTSHQSITVFVEILKRLMQIRPPGIPIERWNHALLTVERLEHFYLFKKKGRFVLGVFNSLKTLRAYLP